MKHLLTFLMLFSTVATAYTTDQRDWTTYYYRRYLGRFPLEQDIGAWSWRRAIEKNDAVVAQAIRNSDESKMRYAQVEDWIRSCDGRNPNRWLDYDEVLDFMLFTASLYGTFENSRSVICFSGEANLAIENVQQMLRHTLGRPFPLDGANAWLRVVADHGWKWSHDTLVNTEEGRRVTDMVRNEVVSANVGRYPAAREEIEGILYDLSFRGWTVEKDIYRTSGEGNLAQLRMGDTFCRALGRRLSEADAHFWLRYKVAPAVTGAEVAVIAPEATDALRGRVPYGFIAARTELRSYDQSRDAWNYVRYLYRFWQGHNPSDSEIESSLLNTACPWGDFERVMNAISKSGTAYGAYKRIDDLYRKYTGHGASAKEAGDLLFGVVSVSDQGWANAELAIAELPDAVRIEIDGLYREFLRRGPSPDEVSYWQYRRFQTNKLVIRYEIATSVEAGKKPRLNVRTLALNDGKIVYDRPRKGYLFACDPMMYRRGGPTVTPGGPWKGATTYDLLQKPHVSGAVRHPSGWFSTATQGDRRYFAGNGIPIPTMLTGIFPVRPWDPAFQYDGNPNGFGQELISFSLPRYPVIAAGGPYCVYREIGISLDGTQINEWPDPIGRNEVANNMQDACGGSTQPGNAVPEEGSDAGRPIPVGLYENHTTPTCFPNAYKNSALIGWALDGFPLISGWSDDGTEILSEDLDECGGKMAWVEIDGETRHTYAYPMTRNWPYSLTCFKGKPMWNAFPPLPGAPPKPDMPAD